MYNIQKRRAGADGLSSQGRVGQGLASGKALLLGGILGIDAVGTCVALASLVFSGPLAGSAATGTALFLLATLVSTMILAGFGGFKGALGIAQDTTIAVIAPAVGTAAGAAAGGGGAGLATGLMILGTSSAITGLAMWVLGRFRLGSAARLMPYPVAVGFLAGSGWILSFAALSLITGGATTYLTVARSLVGPNLVGLTLPTLGLSALILVGQRFFGGVRALFGALLIALISFYTALWVLQIPLDDARSMGLLPSAKVGNPVAGLDLDLLAQTDWNQLPSALPIISVIVVVSIVGLLLNTTGAELALREDIDINLELRVTGLTNIAIGAFGGVVAYLSAASTIMAHRIGRTGPAVTAGYCAVVLVGFLLAGPIVAAVPNFISAGLLLFIGLSMISDWLLGSRKRLPSQDWAIVNLIVLVTMWQGMFTAIAAGLIIALVIFVISYARIPVLRRNLSRPARRSNVDRSPLEEAFLQLHANRVRWAPLQGYLFFGSVEKLSSDVRAIKVNPLQKAWLLLDFSRVGGMDSSACAALEKLSYAARRRNLSLAACGLTDDVAAVMERWQNGFLKVSGIRADLLPDQSLEAIEDELLAECPEGRTAGHGLAKLLDSFVADHPRRADLTAALRPIHLADGEVLIRQGSRSKDIFIIEEGRVSVLVNHSDGPPLRVRSMTSGAIVGEAAAYLDQPRQADIVANGAAKVWCLSEATLAALQHSDFELASLIHALMARALAEKMVRNNARLIDGER